MVRYGWQAKLCGPLVTGGPYMSALAVMLPIIRRYTNHQITLTHTLFLKEDRTLDIHNWSRHLRQ